MLNIGTAITVSISTVGGFLGYLVGGWDIWLQCLLIAMFLDIVTGTLKCIYKKSEKTASGAFRSSVFINGLLRKGACLCVVVIAVEMDAIFMVMGTPLDIALLGSIRNAVILFFWIGEAISILENCGEMGMKLPTPLTKALDVLNAELNGLDKNDEK